MVDGESVELAVVGDCVRHRAEIVDASPNIRFMERSSLIDHGDNPFYHFGGPECPKGRWRSRGLEGMMH